MNSDQLNQLVARHPIVKDLIALKETAWFNPHFTTLAEGLPYVGLNQTDIDDARDRLARFAPYLMEVFPETAATGGMIESELAAIPNMQQQLEQHFGQTIHGKLWLKKDSHLPISGSIKARGGIYEVLCHAEKLALQAGLLSTSDHYAKLNSPEFKQFFSQYSIAVGSTGNLGLSIGIMSAQLGFDVTVHMSADARQWKKDKLRSHGVTVVEYVEDYGVAVEQGRKAALQNPNCFFIDDENSRTLFLGYSVAGQRLKSQLDHVHCIFAEPTHSPCMLLGVATGLHDEISVQEIGIDNITAADGLAVGRASGFVGRAMQRLLDGFYTLDDQTMYLLLGMLNQSEHLKLEPSALAGMLGPVIVNQRQDYAALHYFTEQQLQHSNHIVWGTGGGMVPAEEMEKYLAKSNIEQF